ncbi:hypothetical protein Tco_1536825 [Tanacetum coccineum]
MYFNKGVDRTKLKMEKCIWFRLCGHEQVLTLPQFAVLLGLHEESELKHHLFAVHFTKLEVDDRWFNHDAYWQASIKETCQKRDLWLMSLLEESCGINLAWVIVKHLCKHASGLKENSLICGGHYVTKISQSLGYLVDEDVAKCSEPIECEKWTSKMLVSELDEDVHTLLQTTQVAPQPRGARRQRQEPTGLNSSWGD